MTEFDRYAAEVESVATIILYDQLKASSPEMKDALERVRHHRAADSKEWRDAMLKCLDVLAALRRLNMNVERATEYGQPAGAVFMISRIDENGIIESREDFEARRKALVSCG